MIHRLVAFTLQPLLLSQAKFHSFLASWERFDFEALFFVFPNAGYLNFAPVHFDFDRLAFLLVILSTECSVLLVWRPGNSVHFLLCFWGIIFDRITAHITLGKFLSDLLDCGHLGCCD